MLLKVALEAVVGRVLLAKLVLVGTVPRGGLPAGPPALKRPGGGLRVVWRGCWRRSVSVGAVEAAGVGAADGSRVAHSSRTRTSCPSPGTLAPVSKYEYLLHTPTSYPSPGNPNPNPNPNPDPTLPLTLQP